MPELRLGPEMLLDTCTVLYGPTKSGTSVYVRHLMKTLAGHIDQAIVVNATENSNRCYRGYVPAPCIHTDLLGAAPRPRSGALSASAEKSAASKFLTQISRRQEALVSIHRKVNDPELLRRVYRKVPESARRKYDSILSRVGGAAESCVAKMRRAGTCSAASEELVRAAAERHRVGVLRAAIGANLQALWGSVQESDSEEVLVLQHLYINPRLLLVFDDCAAMLKPFEDITALRGLFYQGRHLGVTTVICCQDDTDLRPNLRKNATYSVFTTPEVANSFFSRNRDTPRESAAVADLAAAVFSVKHAKLVYRRDSPDGTTLYWSRAPIHATFRFGSSLFWAYCEEVGGEDTGQQDNEFLNRLRAPTAGPPAAPQLAGPHRGAARIEPRG